MCFIYWIVFQIYNSFFCSRCSFRVPKCSDIPGRLAEGPDLKFRRCLGNAQAIAGRSCVAVHLANGKLDVVENFVYLGDMCVCVCVCVCVFISVHRKGFS